MSVPQLARVVEIRRANLRRLADQYGTAPIAERLGYTSGSYLSQMIGPNPRRPVTERTARMIEHTFGMRHGALDLPPDRAREAAL